MVLKYHRIIDSYLFYGYYELVALKSLKKDFANFDQANPKPSPGLAVEKKRQGSEPAREKFCGFNSLYLFVGLGVI